MIGDEANISYINSLVNFNNSFETRLIYQRNIKKYIRKISKYSDLLITTRIDYDDRIYYDAVNDDRKVININKHILLYGYKRGVHFYESENIYYEFYST